MDEDEVKRIARMLDDAYEKECRNRPPYMMIAILTCSFVVWAAAIFIVCRAEEYKWMSYI